MKKEELITKVAQATGLKKTEVKKVLESFIETLSESLSKGERTAIPGFGIFSVKQRKARKGRNPRTGKEIKIPARKVVYFKPAKALSQKVK